MTGRSGSELLLPWLDTIVSSVPVISVVGSLNVDHTFRVSRFPEPGETLTAPGAEISFGGKGANQAVAAARAGAEVRMIGCLGRDPHGEAYRKLLEEEGIDHSGVLTGDGATGTAFITVDDSGENTILVDPGANHELGVDMIGRMARQLAESDVLLLQLECPLEVVACAVETARDGGTKVILNPSPWHPGWLECTPPPGILILNEGEAGSLLAGRDLCEEGVFRDLGCEAVVVTRGGGPTQLFTGGKDALEVPPPVVSPVDTVGAGDAFAGALAVAQAEGMNLLDSVRLANAAAALATLKPGAQAAIPRRAEIVEMLG